MKTIFSVLLVLALAPHAYATELFPGGSPNPYPAGAALPAGSTLGGYAIYQGGDGWQINQLALRSTRALRDADSLTLGAARLDYFSPAGHWTAGMWLTANLTAVGRNQYLTGSPCAGAHLLAIDKGKGTQDNCLTVDAQTGKLGSRPVTLLLVDITQAQSAGRVYLLHLYLNLEALGFRDTLPADWSATMVQTDPQRKAFVERLQKWAESLQDGASRALDFSKPQDAFAAVPPIDTLAVLVDKTSP